MSSSALKRWVFACVIAVTFLAVCMLYIVLRRETLSVSNVNKSFASAAVLLAGFTLLIRLLMARFYFFYHFITVRRQLGIFAFIFALIHIFISIFFIPSRFTFEWFLQQWLPIGFGIIAISIWVYLAYLSRNEKIQELGVKKWQKHQNIGARTAFLLIYFHLILLKYTGWMTWFAGNEKKSAFLANPQYIPESFLVFIIMTTIIIVKVIQIRVKGDVTNGNNTTEEEHSAG
jgi:DMSO/TMAO reductase YedYZ heme-binding membrane subunit